MGSHEELLSRGGGYASLIQLHKARDGHQVAGEDDSNFRVYSSDVVLGEQPGSALDEVFSKYGITVQPIPKSRQLEIAEVSNLNPEVVERMPKKSSVPSMRRLLALNKPDGSRDCWV